LNQPLVKRNSIAETYGRKVLSDWRGNHLSDACGAAINLGMLHSSGVLGYERSKEILQQGLSDRGVDDIHWSTVNDAYQIGRCSVINPTEARQRFFPVAANDNKKPVTGFTAFAKMIKSKAASPTDTLMAKLQAERFNLTWFDDVDQSVAKEEILQGVLGAGEFSLFVAKPGTAKSVLVGDMGMHIAAGLDWHGRKVKQGLVVFFAAERKRLTERRVAAWSKKHNVKNIPFVVIGGKLDLTSTIVDATSLARTIAEAEAKCGHKCSLIILDTVTRTFGSGDQHQSRDMQKYVVSVDQMTRATGAHVAAIHHSTWAEDRGKGAIDLDGAIDVSFSVSVKGTGPTKTFTLACTGSNDGEEGDVTTFRLESVPLGTDAAGNVTTAPVVIQADPVASEGSNLKGQTAKALDSLERAIEAHGTEPPVGSPGFPSGVILASREQWKDRFYADARLKEPNAVDDTLSKRFRRAMVDLLTAKQIGNVGEWFWLDSRTERTLSDR
jgi:hypothetical protein